MITMSREEFAVIVVVIFVLSTAFGILLKELIDNWGK